MKLEHIHLKEVPSTQIYLKKLIESNMLPSLTTIVSTDRQTEGIGRHVNKWEHFDHSLALSFTLEPNEKTELTPIECGVILQQFIKAEFDKNIFLKWPNDLMNNKGEKIGGIVSHFLDGLCVIGVGLNLFSKKDPRDFKYGNLFDSDPGKMNYKDLYLLLYMYVIANRFQSHEIPDLFHAKCIHMNNEVEILEDGNEFKGIFTGIDESGAALIKALGESEFKKIYSATLRIC